MCRGKRSKRTAWQEERSSTEVMTAASLADRLLRVVLLALSGSPAMSDDYRLEVAHNTS
jgi:hypothetical protein